ASRLFLSSKWGIGLTTGIDPLLALHLFPYSVTSLVAWVQNPVERPRADDGSYEECAGERNPANCQSCRGLNIELHGVILSVNVGFQDRGGACSAPLRSGESLGIFVR